MDKISFQGGFRRNKEKWRVILSDAESIPTGCLGVLEGLIAEYDTTNLNGVMFSRKTWENAFASESFKRRLSRGAIVGWFGHPAEEVPKPSDVCVTLISYEIRPKNVIWGKFYILDTPVGHIVRNLLKAGVALGISERGMGVIESGGSVGKVEEDSFELDAFDVVFDPAFVSAVPRALVASKNKEMREKFSQVESAVSRGVSKIQTGATLEMLSSILPANSSSFFAVEKRKKSLSVIDESDDYAKLQSERLVIAAEYTARIIKSKNAELKKFDFEYNKIKNKCKRLEARKSGVCGVQSQKEQKALISEAQLKLSRQSQKMDFYLRRIRSLENTKKKLVSEKSSLCKKHSQKEKELSNLLSCFQEMYYKNMCSVYGVIPKYRKIPLMSSVEDVEYMCKENIQTDVLEDVDADYAFEEFKRCAIESSVEEDIESVFSLMPFGGM